MRDNRGIPQDLAPACCCLAMAGKGRNARTVRPCGLPLFPGTGAKAASPSWCHTRAQLDNFEIARQFPVRDGLAELALLPFAGRRVVVDEAVAEQSARSRRRF